MTAPSAISEINDLMTEFANLADNDPRAAEIQNELSRLSLLRYQLDREATAANTR